MTVLHSSSSSRKSQRGGAALDLRFQIIIFLSFSIRGRVLLDTPLCMSHYAQWWLVQHSWRMLCTRPMNIYQKYTNPARGILDLCKPMDSTCILHDMKWRHFAKHPGYCVTHLDYCTTHPGHCATQPGRYTTHTGHCVTPAWEWNLCKGLKSEIYITTTKRHEICTNLKSPPPHGRGLITISPLHKCISDGTYPPIKCLT